jgi:hypothetical protein
MPTCPGLSGRKRARRWGSVAVVGHCLPAIIACAAVRCSSALMPIIGARHSSHRQSCTTPARPDACARCRPTPSHRLGCCVWAKRLAVSTKPFYTGSMSLPLASVRSGPGWPGLRPAGAICFAIRPIWTGRASHPCVPFAVPWLSYPTACPWATPTRTCTRPSGKSTATGRPWGLAWACPGTTAGSASRC